MGRLYIRGSRGLLTGSAAEPRRLAIMAFLAAYSEQGVAHERVMAYLWPDTEAAAARQMLDQAIFSLRRDIGTRDVLLEDGALRLNPEVISSDLAEFRQAMAEGKLEMAEPRYSGPFLDGFHVSGARRYQQWAAEERADLAQTYAAMLELLAGRATERGDYQGAVQWWRKLAAQDPLNPRIALNLMRALEEAGDRANALRQAHIYEVMIQQRLDTPPDRQVVAYAAQLRSREHETDASV